MRQKFLTVFVVAAALSTGATLPSRANDEGDAAGLSKAVAEASISLEQGLKASEREGKAISGKFEIEDGVLQLSIYTMRDGRFREVIVDYKSGSIMKVEDITEVDDLKDAQAQSRAIAKAKVTLDKAVRNSVSAYKAYRAVSVVPIAESGTVVAEITLVKGEDVKKFSEKLE